eukprot:TRINITY_DN113519_c0_g1_i2.p1 TRINITY_DN113519_c0_g1~~TRINITY_DN113519_c0_g1_i2.p1  ORF type:complete len:152 (-),score=0.34 TRINITY_DN113519_c0_g1_i2:178-633(-)
MKTSIVYICLVLIFVSYVYSQNCPRCNSINYSDVHVYGSSLIVTRQPFVGPLYKVMENCWNLELEGRDDVHFRTCNLWEYNILQGDHNLDGRYVLYSSSDGNDIDALIFDNGNLQSRTEEDIFSESTDYDVDSLAFCCHSTLGEPDGEQNT